jgi:ABC-type uncharacterized transport system permease subunit
MRATRVPRFVQNTLPLALIAGAIAGLLAIPFVLKKYFEEKR